MTLVSDINHDDHLAEDQDCCSTAATNSRWNRWRLRKGHSSVRQHKRFITFNIQQPKFYLGREPQGSQSSIQISVKVFLSHQTGYVCWLFFNSFSSCYDENSNQEEIFRNDVEPLIDVVYSGIVGNHTFLWIPSWSPCLDGHYLRLWRHLIRKDTYYARHKIGPRSHSACSAREWHIKPSRHTLLNVFDREYLRRDSIFNSIKPLSKFRIWRYTRMRFMTFL